MGAPLSYLTPQSRKEPLNLQYCDDFKECIYNFNTLDRGRLPTIYHVVETLSEIPVYEILEAKVVDGLGVRDLLNAWRIE